MGVLNENLFKNDLYYINFKDLFFLFIFLVEKKCMFLISVRKFV